MPRAWISRQDCFHAILSSLQILGLLRWICFYMSLCVTWKKLFETKEKQEKRSGTSSSPATTHVFLFFFSSCTFISSVLSLLKKINLKLFSKNKLLTSKHSKISLPSWFFLLICLKRNMWVVLLFFEFYIIWNWNTVEIEI